MMIEPVEKVSEERLARFVDLWTADCRNRPCLREVRWYAVRADGTATAVDNTTGDCWTEELRNEEEAIEWLRYEEV